MLRWAFAFLLLALVAGFFGFGGVATAAAGIARVLFGLFLLVFFVVLAMVISAERRVF